MSIVACVFLQIAHTLKVGRLTRSDIVLNWLHTHHPDLKHFLEGVYHLVGAGLMAILLYSSIPLFTQAWRIDEYVGAQGDFMAPVWPVKLVILIGCAAMLVYDRLTSMRRISSRPRRMLAKLLAAHRHRC